MTPRGKGPLRIAIEDFLDTFGFGQKIGKAIVSILEENEKDVAGDLSGMVELALNSLSDDDPLKGSLGKLSGGTRLTGVGVLIGFALAIGGGLVSALTAPSMRKIEQGMEKRVRSAIPPIQDILAMRHFEGRKSLFGVEEMEKLGYPADFIAGYARLAKPRFGVPEIYNLWRRGLLSDQERVRGLSNFGWDVTEFPQLEALTEQLPGVQDLISMAVREAFNPDFIRRGKLDSELPPEYVRLVGEQGMSAENAERFWIAHWNLPSLRDGFEMLHRLRPGTTNNPFDLDDMRALLKAQDISPGFREPLIEIAFSNYTRVDIRRMFTLGVLDETEVFNAYLDIGYNDERAAKLTEFTIQEDTEESKQLSRSAIQQAYKKRIFDHATALGHLEGIGFSSTNAAIFLDLIDFDRELARTDEILDGIEERFVSGEITDRQTNDLLTPLGLAGTEAADLLDLWQIRRERKIRIPTRNELDKFYLDDVIDRGTYENLLSRKKYLVESVGWFAQQIDERRADQARKEAERIQKEQARLEVSDIRTEYAITRSGIDVTIAELKLIVAELKVFSNQTDDEQVKKDIKERLPLIGAEIIRLKLEQALLKHDREIDISEA